MIINNSTIPNLKFSNSKLSHQSIKDVSSINKLELPEILFLTSYPPRECGIATYSQDLINTLNNKFQNSFKINICPIISNQEKASYNNEPRYILNSDETENYEILANKINQNKNIQLIILQHEFGFFASNTNALIVFLKLLEKPKIIVFHTVLPNPDPSFRQNVKNISNACDSIIVMTERSSTILIQDYEILPQKIEIIQHGTHLVKHIDKKALKIKYNLDSRKIISTFGLLSSGKSIETTLNALPEIIKTQPNILFLIIGKTHPTIVKLEGEIYRQMLEQKVIDLNIQKHVRFINYFLPLNELLEYLQLTDIYLFTSKDPHQAVSGTFSYAISCGCPIISTPIPHAIEILKNQAGIIIDFEDKDQLSQGVIKLLNNENRRNEISMIGLHRMASTAWENSAIAHAKLFVNVSSNKIKLNFKSPTINLSQIKKMTNTFGIIQFSKLNKPDISSGYTLDDNARALIAMCQHYELSLDPKDLTLIQIYLNFIRFCWRSEGYFLNYIDENLKFTNQNSTTNLADAFGRSIWALGYLISLEATLPPSLVSEANQIYETALIHTKKIHSTRAMAFVIKGIYYHQLTMPSPNDINLIKELTDRLVQMYHHESETNWDWYESYLTYANSLIPEALLCAYITTKNSQYKIIAKKTFDFLINKIFTKNNINVISNKGWLNKRNQGNDLFIGGQQPIDVAYTIIALNKFYEVFAEEEYFKKMELSMTWFHGNNYLNQIIYNPCTGGCYDGLEDTYVNLNQGAESTVSYLMARLTLEKYYLTSEIHYQGDLKFKLNPISITNKQKHFA